MNYSKSLIVAYSSSAPSSIEPEFVFALKAEVVTELGSKVAEEERFKLLDGKKMAEELWDTPE